MYIEMLRSKIHRARVTEADLDYVGSLTLDRDLMDAAGLLPHQRVDVVDINNGARLSTYVIEGERGSGVVGINGAAARLVHVDDLVIVIGYAAVDIEAQEPPEPLVVFVEGYNQAYSIGHDPASAPD